jgi:hypothetical protein
MIQFQVGKTYQTRSPCDYDCIIEATCIRRTDKSVTMQLRDKTRTFRPRSFNVDNGRAEYIRPWGNYSMCPIMSADREKVAS